MPGRLAQAKWVFWHRTHHDFKCLSRFQAYWKTNLCLIGPGWNCLRDISSEKTSHISNSPTGRKALSRLYRHTWSGGYIGSILAALEEIVPSGVFGESVRCVEKTESNKQKQILPVQCNEATSIKAGSEVATARFRCRGLLLENIGTINPDGTTSHTRSVQGKIYYGYRAIWNSIFCASVTRREASRISRDTRSPRSS